MATRYNENFKIEVVKAYMDRCKRFALCLVLTVRFRSLAPWGKLFQLFI